MLKSASDMLEVLFQAPSALKGKFWSCCTSCPVLSSFAEGKRCQPSKILHDKFDDVNLMSCARLLFLFRLRL